jgi:large subunit ribosomal protein L36e
MAPRYELAVGLRKGHRTTKIRVGKTKQDKKHTIRPSRLKGVSLK